MTRLSLSLCAGLLKLLCSLGAQGVGLLLCIINDRPCREELRSSLKGGSLWGWKIGGSLAAPERDRRVEDIVESVLGGEEERHLEGFWEKKVSVHSRNRSLKLAVVSQDKESRTESIPVTVQGRLDGR